MPCGFNSASSERGSPFHSLGFSSSCFWSAHLAVISKLVRLQRPCLLALRASCLKVAVSRGFQGISCGWQKRSVFSVSALRKRFSSVWRLALCRFVWRQCRLNGGVLSGAQPNLRVRFRPVLAVVHQPRFIFPPLRMACTGFHFQGPLGIVPASPMCIKLTPQNHVASQPSP